jgi:tetratricopeptide (TPR) repeat protein
METNRFGKAEERMDTHSKIKEAEVYCSMGLFSEALGVYEKIIGDPSGLDDGEKEKIQTAIVKVQEEITKEKESAQKEVSGEEISRIQKTLSGSGNVQALLDGAFALKELGHYEEAVTEYGRLLQLDYPTAKIVPEIASCLARFESQDKAMAAVRKLLEGPKRGKKEKARIQFRIGFEIEKRGDKDLARHLYYSARKIDPDDKEIEARLETLDQPISVRLPEAEERDGGPTDPDAGGALESYEKRREHRIATRVPDFIYVEFFLETPTGKGKDYHLNVVNYSSHGIGLLVSEKDFGLLKLIKKGDKINKMTFYASWALITVDTSVRHMTRVDEGPYGGMYVIGVEARELITSAQPS